MNDDNTTLIIMAAAGLAVSLSAIPLIIGRVPRNRWYGFRLPSTLADDRVWYQANREMGWFLMGVGLLPCLLAAPTFLSLFRVPAFLILAVMGLSAPVAIAYGAHRAQKLKEQIDSQA
jgi:uncharacterized membrane protein